MSPATSDRAADYTTAKRRFRDSLVELMDCWRKAGLPDSSQSNIAVELLSMSTETFLTDPDSHYPHRLLDRFDMGMFPGVLRGMEEDGLVPPGFLLQTVRSFTWVGRNRIRYQYPHTPDDQISYGIHLQFPERCS